MTLLRMGMGYDANVITPCYTYVIYIIYSEYSVLPGCTVQVPQILETNGKQPCRAWYIGQVENAMLSRLRPKQTEYGVQVLRVRQYVE